MWDMIYGLTDGNQHSNWAGDGGGGHLFIQGVGQVVEQIVQTNINLLFTRDRSAQSFAIFIHNKFYYYKAIILTTFASTAFQMTGFSL